MPFEERTCLTQLPFGQERFGPGVNRIRSLGRRDERGQQDKGCYPKMRLNSAAASAPCP